ncbi:MAG: hypothetical protein LQ352_006055, partial [Teloschistes flavicans]
MRGFTITAAIGAAAFAIHGVSGAALPIGATNLNANLEKRDALADPNILTTGTLLQSRADPHCVWQYRDTTGNCQQLIASLNFQLLPQLLSECYHYSCTCKRDLEGVEAEPKSVETKEIDLVKRDPIAGELAAHPPPRRPSTSLTHNLPNILSLPTHIEANPATDTSASGGPLAPGCKRVKLRVDCHDLRQRVCTIDTTCCNDGCNNPNIIGKRDHDDNNIPEPEAPTSRTAFPPRIQGGSKDKYPHCGAPICKLRRALGLMERDDNNVEVDAGAPPPSSEEAASSEKLAYPPSVRGGSLYGPSGSLYPHCGAPICKVRRALGLKERVEVDAGAPPPLSSEEAAASSEKLAYLPSVRGGSLYGPSGSLYPHCGAPICKLRRALGLKERDDNNVEVDAGAPPPSSSEEAAASSEKLAYPPSVRGGSLYGPSGSLYPHCGAPICK